MSDHFGPIGFHFESAEAMGSTIASLSDALEEEFRDRSTTHLRWSDASGASVAVHLENGAIVCATPFFAPPEGLTRWRVRTSAPHEDSACQHCGGADCDILDAGGELVTRATIQWLHFAPYRRWLAERRSYELEIAAFAQRSSTFEDEEAFARAAPAGLGALKDLAPNAFLPTGMFGQPGGDVSAAATALFAGRVSRSDVRANSRGGPFRTLRVETLPGPVDVVAVASPTDPPPRVGSIALVEGWLVGRPLERPARPGLLRRLGFGS